MSSLDGCSQDQKADLAGHDLNARSAYIVAAPWPERCKAQVSAGGYLIGSAELNKIRLPPKAEYQWWYQYYLATERGVLGYDKYRHDFGKLIWQIASPKWDCDDATLDDTGASFDNPDYVAIVISKLPLAARSDCRQGEIRQSRKAAGPTSGHRRAHDHPWR
jgi:hypothetical protein